ncbi:DUF3040 domain-containing protein [Brevibacterium sp. UMB1308A]|uniref:DUF3040 domain-containing protein n=1 Tax=Brevibacterium sp. UMB1308A TaxID=3050608 RepID=UPI002551A6BF|nr:DUF3040 domain-containing protein [Brevibacterium sp. UMB1308A]MDK8346452.1 DUF3040 domain-containing protein [Brevibacterium sp. UMB1308B]MDK8713297.1 DUF3040 domain-containing protein [Brevibacterium sp. UMB1308A]
MALSEHEQQLLDQLEKQLRNEDPRFAQNISQSHSPAGIALSPKHLVTGTLVMVVGLAVALGAVFFLTSPLSTVGGVLGFFLMVGGAYYAFAVAPAAKSHESAPKAQGKANKPNKSGFMNRVEERWDKRRGSF